MSPLKYFHLSRCSFLHATPVRNLLRHLHAAQGLVCPLAKLSSRLKVQLCGAKFCRCCHSLQWMTFVPSFFFSTLAHTSLLISGGAIPPSRYSSLTLVGLKHPVIDLHASFSSGSRLEACGGLAQTGHAYSAAA